MNDSSQISFFELKTKKRKLSELSDDKSELNALLASEDSQFLKTEKCEFSTIFPNDIPRNYDSETFAKGQSSISTINSEITTPLDLCIKKEEEEIECAICSDKATGLHYGILTCEG